MLNRRSFLKTVGVSAVGSLVCGGVVAAKFEETPHLNYIDVKDYVEYHEFDINSTYEYYAEGSNLKGTGTAYLNYLNEDGRSVFAPIILYDDISIDYLKKRWFLPIAKCREITVNSREYYPISRCFEIPLKTKNIGLFEVKNYLIGLNLDRPIKTYVHYMCNEISANSPGGFRAGIYSTNVFDNIVCAKIS